MRKDLSILIQFLVMPFFFYILSCQGGGSTEDEADEIGEFGKGNSRESKVELISFEIPDGRDKYRRIETQDFVNGLYSVDIQSGNTPAGFRVDSEERIAMRDRIFTTGPGFLWEVRPPVPVIIKMSSRGQLHKVFRDADPETGLVAVSLFAFNKIFPPAFRERYELTISSYPDIEKPFSFTYAFNVRKDKFTPVFMEVVKGDEPIKIKLGHDTPSFMINKIIPKSGCNECTIEVGNVEVVINLKSFTELPALPTNDRLRLTTPRRYSGVLVKRSSNKLKPIIKGNNTEEVTIEFFIPAQLTTFPKWCAGKGDVLCRVFKGGSKVATYFRFLNAVPTEKAQDMLGGLNGFASLSISGTAKAIIQRDGFVMEEKKIILDSGEYHVLENPTIPVWVLEDLKNALFSGAPEFND